MGRSAQAAAIALSVAIASPAYGAMQPARPSAPTPPVAAPQNQSDVRYSPLEPPTLDSPIERRGKNRLVGTWVPVDDVVFGIGMYRVQKDRRSDPNRNHPLRDTYGKTQGVAAVGMSFSF